MQHVCWICGHGVRELLAKGGKVGQCDIPEGVQKDAAGCILRNGEAQRLVNLRDRRQDAGRRADMDNCNPPSEQA